LFVHALDYGTAAVLVDGRARAPSAAQDRVARLTPEVDVVSWPAFLKPIHRGINVVALCIAGRTGSLVDLEHVGRRSGTIRHTPVRAFRRGETVAVGANFGAESDWVKNVLAAGRCSMTMSGRQLMLTGPCLVTLPDASWVFPVWFRLGLRYLVHTDRCLVMTVTSGGTHDVGLPRRRHTSSRPSSLTTR
jgi:deazaflavin-dependent oxidoreductase (nitroreductase family)